MAKQLKGHYTVLVAGCLTCPAFLGSYPGVEAVHRDYASKGVKFLVSLENADPDAPLNLTVRYFACSDDPAWCKPVEQEYSIHLARDEFGGAVFGRTFVPGGPFRDGPSWEGPGQWPSGRPFSGFGGQRPQAGRPGSAGPPNAETLFSRFDRNGDGKLTEGEVPAGLWQRLCNTDANDDGAITPEEFGKNRNRRP